jgi:hypothetical protein
MKCLHLTFGLSSLLFTVYIYLILVLYVILLLVPYKPIEWVLPIIKPFLPDKYWLYAIPTHFIVTMLYIFIMNKAYNYYIYNPIPAKQGNIIII